MSSYLYHWTHSDNLASILAGGLDPAYAEGRLPAVWCCNDLRVNWALWHVATRHGWEPDAMILIRVASVGITLKKTCQRGVFTVKDVIAPDRFRGVRVDPTGAFLPAGLAEVDSPPPGI